MTDEVSDFIIVAEFVAKNVTFVTTATNRPCNLLIISHDYRVQKLLWKDHDFLHRKVIFPYQTGAIPNIIGQKWGSGIPVRLL